MKKLFLLAALFFVAATFSSCEHKTLTIKTPGTLSQLLTDYEKNKITELTIIGNLNDEDIATLNTLTRLAILDMEHVNLEVLPNYAFYTKKSLTSVKLPKTLKTIGEYAFVDCSSLTSITIPGSVTSIGINAFYVCSSLTAFYGKFASSDNRYLIVDSCLNSFAPAGLTSYTIPDGVTTIGDMAFALCCGLTNITIPDGVTTIGDMAFALCCGLTNITIPDGVTTIGNMAFFACNGLTSVTIPDSVITIGDYAFSDCSSLTSLTIPGSVTSIGVQAFGNSDLISVTIGSSAPIDSPDKKPLTITVEIPGTLSQQLADYYKAEIIELTIIGRLSASDMSMLKNLPNLAILDMENTDLEVLPSEIFQNKTSLTSVKLPKTLTTIGHSAFRNCTSLKSVTIGNRVKEIGFSAFANCSRLTSVTIPDNVMSIGNFAFYECSNLTSVTIGYSVKKIEFSAFSNCI